MRFELNAFIRRHAIWLLVYIWRASGPGRDQDVLLPSTAMQLAPAFLALLALATGALACPGEDGHDHVHKRELPQVPLTPPSRPLEWGDVNIIHTTDSHGWLLGHQKLSAPEPNYRWAGFGLLLES